MNDLTIEDYEDVLADKRRLTRELDVAMHGEEGAAKQASLCDLIDSAMHMRNRIQHLEKTLELIASCQSNAEGDVVDIARKALREVK